MPVPEPAWAGRDTSTLSHEQIHRWVHEGADPEALAATRDRHAAQGAELRSAADRLRSARTDLSGGWSGRDADVAAERVRALSGRLAGLGDAVTEQAAGLERIRLALLRVQAAVGPPRAPVLGTLAVSPGTAGLPAAVSGPAPDGFAAFTAARAEENAAREAYRAYLQESGAAARSAPSSTAAGPVGGTRAAPGAPVPAARGGGVSGALAGEAPGATGAAAGHTAPGPLGPSGGAAARGVLARAARGGAVGSTRVAATGPAGAVTSTAPVTSTSAGAPAGGSRITAVLSGAGTTGATTAGAATTGAATADATTTGAGGTWATTGAARTGAATTGATTGAAGTGSTGAAERTTSGGGSPVVPPSVRAATRAPDARTHTGEADGDGEDRHLVGSEAGGPGDAGGGEDHLVAGEADRAEPLTPGQQVGASHPAAVSDTEASALPSPGPPPGPPPAPPPTAGPHADPGMLAPPVGAVGGQGEQRRRPRRAEYLVEADPLGLDADAGLVAPPVLGDDEPDGGPR